MRNKNNPSDLMKAEWVLRIAVFGTFVGHGVFALLVKKGWIPYFNAVGIPTETAIILLPIIGIVDIIAGFIILIRPVKSVLLWAVLWAFITALIRPISGEPIWDFVERSSNWGAPLALLYLRGFPRTITELFSFKK